MTIRQVDLPGCRIDLVRREVKRAELPAVRLTAQEASLLGRLAASKGTAVSRQSLLVDVWDYHPNSRSRAPDVAIRRLRQKIEVDPAEPRHIHTVLGQGWALREAEPGARPPTTELLGRAALLHEIDALLRGRGACLVGPAGVGKTALAEALDAVPVRLEGVDSESGMLAAVAAALHLPTGGVNDLGSHIGTALRERERVLWLDAPEAVLGPVQHWLDRWAGRFLVTSRIPVTGLTVVEVPPLGATDSATLFRRIAPEAKEVERLLEGLDGLPLAIRLVAARARQVGTAALLDSKGVRYERISAVGDALARGWTLLDSSQRQLLIALAPLVQAFDVGDAETIAGPGQRWVGDVLVELVRTSFLTREPGPRFRMLQSVRWYVSQQGAPPVDQLIDWALTGSGTWPTLQRLLDLAEEQRPERLTELVLAVDDAMADTLTASTRLAVLRRGEGLEVRLRRARIAWALGEQGALGEFEALVAEAAGTSLAGRAVVGLAKARRASSRAESVDALRDALESTADLEGRIEILTELAEQHSDRREFHLARVTLHRALAIGGRRPDILCALGHIALLQDRPEDGLDAVVEAVRLAPDGPIGERGWRTLGGLHYLTADLESAATAWEHARTLAQELGLWRQYAVTLGNLGRVYADLGDLALARRILEDALARSQELNQLQTEVPALLNLGAAALQDGTIPEGRELLERAVALAAGLGWTHHEIEGRLGLAVAEQLEGRDASHALGELISEAEAAGRPREAALAAAHLALHTGQAAPGDALLEAARASLSRGGAGRRP